MSTVTVDMKEYNSMKQQIGSFPRKLKAAARLGAIKSFSWGLGIGMLSMLALYMYY